MGVLIVLEHPGASQPSRVVGGDTRNLALAVWSVRLIRREERSQMLRSAQSYLTVADNRDAFVNDHTGMLVGDLVSMFKPGRRLRAGACAAPCGC